MCDRSAQKRDNDTPEISTTSESRAFSTARKGEGRERTGGSRGDRRLLVRMRNIAAERKRELDHVLVQRDHTSRKALLRLTMGVLVDRVLREGSN